MTDAERKWREAKESLASLHESLKSDDGIQGWEIALAERRCNAAVRAAFAAGVKLAVQHGYAVMSAPLPSWLPEAK